MAAAPNSEDELGEDDVKRATERGAEASVEAGVRTALRLAVPRDDNRPPPAFAPPPAVLYFPFPKYDTLSAS